MTGKEFAALAAAIDLHVPAGKAAQLIADYRASVVAEVQRADAAMVRALAPKYLDTAEHIAVFLALDKAAGEIDPDKETGQGDDAKLLWRIREALAYMSQVSQPNENTLWHIRRYLRGENDGMPAMSDGSEPGEITGGE